MRKWLNARPVLKSAIIIGGIGLWSVGLAEQFADLTATAKYVGVSILLVAVAMI